MAGVSVNVSGSACRPVPAFTLGSRFLWAVVKPGAWDYNGYKNVPLFPNGQFSLDAFYELYYRAAWLEDPDEYVNGLDGLRVENPQLDNSEPGTVLVKVRANELAPWVFACPEPDYATGDSLQAFSLGVDTAQFKDAPAVPWALLAVAAGLMLAFTSKGMLK